MTALRAARGLAAMMACGLAGWCAGCGGNFYEDPDPDTRTEWGTTDLDEAWRSRRREGVFPRDRTAFDRLTVRFAAAGSRRRLLGRAAKVGVAAVATAALGTRAASAQTCPYGAFTCADGYVWREAFPGDIVCVEPWVRDQMAYDNANQAGRVAPNGLCVSGYVYRDAYNGDGVCVEPWVRDQVHADNALAGSRIEPGCALETQV